MKTLNILLGIISSIFTLFFCYCFVIFLEAFIKYDDIWHNISLYLIILGSLIGLFVLFIPFFVLWFKGKRRNMKFSFYSFVSFIFMIIVLMILNLIDLNYHFDPIYFVLPLLFLIITLISLIYYFRKSLINDNLNH